MNVLFLDIDGVVNSEATLRKAGGGIVGIDPYLAFLIGNMVDDLGLKVVLSSSWRHWPDGMKTVSQQVCPLIDKTGDEPYNEVGADPIKEFHTQRGREIKKWLNAHPEVLRYAIVDDDSDMLPEQLPNFFKTSWKTGVTPEIIEQIKNHFK